VTYWNATIAATHGMSVRTAGVCDHNAPGATICTAQNGCAAGTYCNLGDPSLCAPDCPAACWLGSLPGQCWGLPLDCSATAGDRPHVCGDLACSDNECQLIKDGARFYIDAMCN
jgi:hypothetical protein